MSAPAAALENPLRHGLDLPREAERCTMTILGASGDLAKRKLVPALFSLYADGLLPPGFAVLGAARTDLTDETFRTTMRGAVAEFSRRKDALDAVWERFAGELFYQRLETDDYVSLGRRLEEVARLRGAGPNRVFYLATPPGAVEGIVRNLGQSKLVHGSGCDAPWTRVIVEKPFGQDLPSARALNAALAAVLREEQIYRIDHYLGKETVQNLLVLRFANGIFEPVWNRRYVDHVQITVAETIGIEGRAAYFERAGILRDIVQNHMLQLLAMTALEPPITFEADAVRGEKVKVLSALRPLGEDVVARSVVRGQYGRALTGAGEVPGYREEPGVAPSSTVETYVALETYVDSWRWAGVPFYLRAGKRLAKRVTEIAVQFRQVPLPLFERMGADPPDPSVLAVRIQPDEGITLKFAAKVPGPTIRLQSVNMDFRYGTSFAEEPPEAYERLLLDVLLGDSTLFTRRDEVEAAWEFIDPIRAAWSAQPTAPVYPAGTWGPPEADALLTRSGRAWRRL